MCGGGGGGRGGGEPPQPPNSPALHGLNALFKGVKQTGGDDDGDLVAQVGAVLLRLRHEHAVPEALQGVLEGHGGLVARVEAGGADLPVAQGLVQRRVVEGGAAVGVDQNHARLHVPEGVVVEGRLLLRGGAARVTHAHDVHPLQELVAGDDVEVLQAAGFRRRLRVGEVADDDVVGAQLA